MLIISFLKENNGVMLFVLLVAFSEYLDSYI